MRGPATWKTVIEPFRGTPSIDSLEELSVRRMQDFMRGDFGCEGVALRICRQGIYYDILVGNTCGEKQFGDTAFDGISACVRYDSEADLKADAPSYVFMAGASRLAVGSFRLLSDRLTTAYVERNEDGEYSVSNIGDAHADISLS
jgi:hypothetical protein